MAKKKDTAEQAQDQSGSTDAPGTQSLTIQGIPFQAPAPYAEGHPLTANEAVALNQTFGENLRNNFAKQVSAAKDAFAKANGDDADLTPDVLEDLASKFAAYAAQYQFNGRRQAQAPTDPIGKEAYKIASSILNEHLRKKNFDKKTLEEGRFEEMVEQLIAKDPAIRAEAERRIKAVKAVAASALDDMLEPQAQAAE